MNVRRVGKLTRAMRAVKFGTLAWLHSYILLLLNSVRWVSRLCYESSAGQLTFCVALPNMPALHTFTRTLFRSHSTRRLFAAKRVREGER